MLEVLVTLEDVSVMRLQRQAQAQVCRVVQDIKTRNIVLLPVDNVPVVCADVDAAASWLRHYWECGVLARRCLVDGNRVCSVH